MIKDTETLQNAEYALRNWTQANADELDRLSLSAMCLICDMIRHERNDMKHKWE